MNTPVAQTHITTGAIRGRGNPELVSLSLPSQASANAIGINPNWLELRAMHTHVARTGRERLNPPSFRSRPQFFHLNLHACDAHGHVPKANVGGQWCQTKIMTLTT